MEKKKLRVENIMGTASVPKLMVKYCLPAVIAMMITGVQGMIDGMFVGNYIGSNALASVNIALPFMQVIIGVSMVISIGTQSYVGIKLGSGEKQRARDAFVTFGMIIAIIAMLLTVLGVTLSEQIGTLLGADDVLLPDVSTYIMYLSIFALPVCIMFYFGFLCRVIGKPERYLYGAILSVVLNVSLDYLFIAQFNMGILGAALATGIAYSSALIFSISPMFNRKSVINVFAGRFSKQSIGSVLYNGSSEGVNSLSIALTAFLFNISLMQIAGPGGVSAFTAINYVGSLGSMLLFGISDGIGPLVSFNFGMGDIGRVNKIMKFSYLCNLFIGTVLFILLFFFGEVFAGMFISDNPELVELAATGGRIYAFAFFMSGFNILNSGYFTFIGRGLESVIVAASRGVVFVSIGIFVLPTFFEMDGIWLSVPFAELCAVIVGFLLVVRTRKKLNKSGMLAGYDGTGAKPAEISQPIEDAYPKRIITISRGFGSGGREVGKRVAEALAFAYYDKELLIAVSEKTGMDLDIVAKIDDNSERNFRYTFGRSFKTYNELAAGEVAGATSDILKEISAKSSCVIIGRCSDYILRDNNPLKVFIYSSDMDFRVKRCFDKVPEDKKSKNDMMREILRIDKRRGEYYEGYTGKKWADMTNYSLCIDTSVVGISGAVDIILEAVKSGG